MAEITREELHHLIDMLREDQKASHSRVQDHIEQVGLSITSRLDVLNSRTAKAESAISVLQDRSEDAKVARWIDRGVAGLAAGLLSYFTWHK